MVTVTISEDDLLDLLVERVKYWTDDEETVELFEQYYENMVYSGCFEGAELDIISIVDNDYVNNTSIVTREEYEKDRVAYLKDKIQDFIKENKDLYSEEEKADYIKELKSSIDDFKEEAPEFDDLETGWAKNVECEDWENIESKTDNLLLISW